MCKPAPQTPVAGTTNKSFMCLNTFTFVNALHYIWGDGRTGFCCYSIDCTIDYFLLSQSCWGSRPSYAPWDPCYTPTWWTYWVVRSGHWLTSTLIWFLLRISCEISVFWLSNNHTDHWILTCSMSGCTVCWFGPCYLKYKIIVFLI